MDPKNNPYAILLAKLAGFERKPKARTPMQQYQVEEGDMLRDLYKTRWAAELLDGTKTPGSRQSAKWRTDIVKEKWVELSEAQQKEYATKARLDGDRKRAEYDRLMQEGPSRSPEARQKCVAMYSKVFTVSDHDASALNNLAAFLGPILRGLYEYTGMHATVFMGGPVPACGGDIRVHTMCVGSNHGAVGLSWQEFDPAYFESVKVNLMKYLSTAFSACYLPCLSALSNSFFSSSREGRGGSQSGATRR